MADAATGDKNPTPALRLGEIRLPAAPVQRRGRGFARAVRRSRLVEPNNDLAVAQAQLDRGAALLAAGRNARARRSFGRSIRSGRRASPIRTPGRRDSTPPSPSRPCPTSPREQLADYERRVRDLHAAIEDYTTALSWSDEVREVSGVRPEVLNNNAALADLGLGATSTAASLENKAPPHRTRWTRPSS